MYEEAKAAIEQDILTKEVPLSIGEWGIRRDSCGVWVQHPTETCCPLGVYLLGRSWIGRGVSFVDAAAESLKVPQFWIVGVLAGWDGEGCETSKLTDYNDGRAFGVYLCGKYLGGPWATGEGD